MCQHKRCRAFAVQLLKIFMTVTNSFFTTNRYNESVQNCIKNLENRNINHEIFVVSEFLRRFRNDQKDEKQIVQNPEESGDSLKNVTGTHSESRWLSRRQKGVCGGVVQPRPIYLSGDNYLIRVCVIGSLSKQVWDWLLIEIEMYLYIWLH